MSNMKTIKVSDLAGETLDWAVAKCVGIPKLEAVWERLQHSYLPSTDWSQGGPIIEREGIGFFKEGSRWVCTLDDGIVFFEVHGPTLLIAAMRCYVTTKLGDTVEVPKELTK